MIPSVMPTYARAPMTFVKGEGVWLEADDGRRYMDLGGGIAVNALGHANPDLNEALTEQASKIWHLSNLYRIGPQQELADRLVEATFADTVFFTNSGTEACELAVKMARKHHHDKGSPERVEIVTFEGCFHGRSSAAIAAAGTEKMVGGFGPVLGGFAQVPWADHDALRAAVTDRTAAVLIEPIMGEGGIKAVPDHCLRGLRDLCDEKGALLIFDEVQCGVGRTGKLFAHEWAGISPDAMMVGKGIGGGFPLGAVLATENAASGMVVGTHGSTYGGNPLACAVGTKVVGIINDEAFLDHIRRVGGRLRQKVEGIAAAHPDLFAGVRGAGLMLGLEAKVPAGDFVKKGFEAGVLLVPSAENVLRLLPPLNITEAEVDAAATLIDKTANMMKEAGQ